MTARMRRLMSDFEQVKKDFAGHKNIIITPIGNEIPEKYHITYFVNGIYLLPDGRIETLGRHEVELTLHAEYPRYKPLCNILTPIWHPNFRDGQICIGDIWGAGESLTDIIINIGDMIQYKSWNSYSPLSADAAQWAMENKHLFPVGNIELRMADYASARDVVDIDFFDGSGNVIEEKEPENIAPDMNLNSNDSNDFEITAEELAGIEFIPTAQRMQSVSQSGYVKGGKFNIKTVLIKGLLWAFIGAIIGFGLTELTDKNLLSNKTAANLSGYSELADYYEYQEKVNELDEKIYSEYEKWCKKNGYDKDDNEAMSEWILSGEMSSKAEQYIEDYYEYDEKSTDELYEIFTDKFDEDLDEFEKYMEKSSKTIIRVSTALWSAIIALFVGLFLGIGEGVFYGSKEKALKYALIGAVVSIIMGFLSGYLAQLMYSELIENDTSDITAALIRGLGWAVMGLGIGLAVGLIKPQAKRVLFCSLGGLAGGFIGGFLFNYICDVIPNDIVARGVALVIMGLLIGVGVGVLEQFAKQAWLKVIRGEFEGKEYLVFAGTTSIGNNGKNTIVLFKDKLVGPHHCDIKLEGSKYVLIDCGTPMGTVVNGNRTARHILRQGDAIAIGNSVLIFNTK